MSASTGEHRTAVPCWARAAIPRGEADVTDGRYARMGPAGSATAADPDDPDRILDARFAEGDQTALREAYDRHGSAVFGIGWGIANTCPGPVAAQLGQGALWSLLTIAGILVGTRLRQRHHGRIRVADGIGRRRRASDRADSQR